LNSRIVIEQAKGALAQMHSCSVDQAFDLLRSYSRSQRLGLSEVARGVVTDPQAFPGLTA
jgi:AmiR/NasT family two-component response regulator